MLTSIRHAFLGLQRPLYPSALVCPVRCVSSRRANVLPVIRRGEGKLLSTGPILPLQQQRAPIKCWIDASIKNGLIAVVIGNKYKVFRTKPQDGVAGRNIHWAETVAFELLTHILLVQRFTGSITVYSDSQAALGAFNGFKSRDYLVAASSARLQAQRPLWPFQIRSEWVASKHNIADPYTRSKPAAVGYEELRHRIKLSETLKLFVYQD